MGQHNIKLEPSSDAFLVVPGVTHFTNLEHQSFPVQDKQSQSWCLEHWGRHYPFRLEEPQRQRRNTEPREVGAAPWIAEGKDCLWKQTEVFPSILNMLITSICLVWSPKGLRRMSAMLWLIGKNVIPLHWISWSHEVVSVLDFNA